MSHVPFFIFKKRSHLVEALSQEATARATATSTTARVEARENTSERFKYAKDITGSQEERWTEGGGVVEGSAGGD